MAIVLANLAVGAAVMAGLQIAAGQPAANDQAKVTEAVRTAHETAWSDATQVVVEAPVPGPAMWKLTRGTSTVWVLGVLEQTPQDLSWDNHRLRRILSGANALIVPGNTIVGEPALRQWQADSKIGAGQRASDYVSIRAQNRIERLARTEAHTDGLDRLYKPVRLGVELHAIVRANHRIELYRLVKDVESLPEAAALPKVVPFNASADYLARGLLNLSRAGDDACLLDYLDDIDWDLDVLPAASQAWASGDILALEKDYRSPPGLVCNLLVPNWKQQYETYNITAMAKTLDGALSVPGKSVALIPLGDLLHKGAILDRMQSEGVVMTSPPGDEAGVPSGSQPK